MNKVIADFFNKNGGLETNEISIIKHGEKEFLFTGCKHFNGHFSGYKESVYEVYGRSLNKSSK